MAGGCVQDAMIGVGSALRKARSERGLTLDAASRDTASHGSARARWRTRTSTTLMGDVYVRGSLRTYAQYLGL